MSQIQNDDNAEHFFVATQERALQQRVMSCPGGASMFVTVNGIQLAMPPKSQKMHALKKGEEKMLPGLLERQSNLLEEGSEHKTGIQYRRKKARGPNPLSIRKKSTQTEDSSQNNEHALEEKKKKRRVRKSRLVTGTEEQT